LGGNRGVDGGIEEEDEREECGEVGEDAEIVRKEEGEVEEEKLGDNKGVDEGVEEEDERER